MTVVALGLVEGLRRRAAGVCALALAGALGGCSLLSSTPAVDTFDLRKPEVVALRKERALQVLVPEPTADHALDTERIVVRPSPSQIAYFSGAQWADRLPRLIQARLVESFDASSRFRAAGRPGQGLAIDRQIVTEIAAFDYDAGNARVEVALSVKLMDDRTGRVLASERFRAEEASSDDAKAMVAAFDRAQLRVLGEIVAWVAKRG